MTLTETSTADTPLSPAVRLFDDRATLGQVAAADIADALRARLSRQETVRMVFAAAPSQAETLAALAAEPDIDWSRITAFHMDEYIGLAADDPAGFGNWLRKALFERVTFGAVHYIEPGSDPIRSAADYAVELLRAPIDVIVLGIGVNGHIAFNDPPVADIDDPLDVKVVELDDECRQQQVDDDCFPNFDAVPTHAITLTVPRLLAADQLFCVVPGAAKRDAVRRALTDPIGVACPATALRSHPRCTLYLDAESGADVALLA